MQTNWIGILNKNVRLGGIQKPRSLLGGGAGGRGQPKGHERLREGEGDFQKLLIILANFQIWNETLENFIITFKILILSIEP